MKKILIFYVLLIIALTGCSNITQDNTKPAISDAKSITESKLNSSAQAELKTSPKAVSDYTIYTGNWICKEKKTSMSIEVDAGGNVKGSITTVVGTHVPSSSIEGVIENGLLVSELAVDDVDPGTLFLLFTDPKVLKGNIELEKKDEAYWTLADGEMIFERY